MIRIRFISALSAELTSYKHPQAFLLKVTTFTFNLHLWLRNQVMCSWPNAFLMCPNCHWCSSSIKVNSEKIITTNIHRTKQHPTVTRNVLFRSTNKAEQTDMRMPAMRIESFGVSDLMHDWRNYLLLPCISYFVYLHACRIVQCAKQGFSLYKAQADKTKVKSSWATNMSVPKF